MIQASLSHSSSIHAASSSVYPESYSIALAQLLDIDIPRPLLVDFVVDCVLRAVEYSDSLKLQGSMSLWGTERCHDHSKIFIFVTDILKTAQIRMSVILAALAYIDRAKPRLQRLCDTIYRAEKVFLGAVMIASKYLNDRTLHNVHWARCARLFGLVDVGRVEREFLQVLDWELGLSAADLLAHYSGLVSISVSVASSSALSRGHSAAAPRSRHSVAHSRDRRRSVARSPLLLPIPSSASLTVSPSQRLSSSRTLVNSVWRTVPDVPCSPSDSPYLTSDSDSDSDSSPLQPLTPPSDTHVEPERGRKTHLSRTHFSRGLSLGTLSPLARFADPERSG